MNNNIIKNKLISNIFWFIFCSEWSTTTTRYNYKLQTCHWVCCLANAL